MISNAGFYGIPILAAAILAIFTRRKAVAMVLPCLIPPVVYWRDLDLEGLQLALGFLLAALLPVIPLVMCAALAVWQIMDWFERRQEIAALGSISGSPQTGQVPSGEIRKFLQSPMSAEEYCTKYGVTQVDIDTWTSSGAIKAYGFRKRLWVEDAPPPR